MNPIRVHDGNLLAATTPKARKVAQPKLTPEDVVEIRRLMARRDSLLVKARRLTAQALAEVYGVHPQQINKIAKRKQWKAVA